MKVRRTTTGVQNVLCLRVRPPGIEWKTGRNPKMGKKVAKKIENGPRPEMGEKCPKNVGKMGFFYFFAIFGPFFPYFRPMAIFFYFFGQLFPIFGFRPVFHAMPGGLTRNTLPPGGCKSLYGPNPEEIVSRGGRLK